VRSVHTDAVVATVVTCGRDGLVKVPLHKCSRVDQHLTCDSQLWKLKDAALLATITMPAPIAHSVLHRDSGSWYAGRVSNRV
jgi:hypothetical protein